MSKFRIVFVLLAAAFAISLAGETANALPPQAQRGIGMAQGKVPTQGQAGLAKAGLGQANGGQGLQQAGGNAPTQGQVGLAKAGQGSANGGQKGQKGGK